MVFNGGTPFVLMGSVEGSLRAYERLRELEVDVVVPGHGPVCGPELFDTMAGYLRWTQQLARDAFAAGVDPLTAAMDADLGPFADWHDPERIAGNLHRAFAELAGAAARRPDRPRRRHRRHDHLQRWHPAALPRLTRERALPRLLPAAAPRNREMSQFLRR